MTTRRKIILRTLAAIFGVLFFAVLLAPLWFNLDHYRPQIISYFEQTTGKKVEIERVSLKLLPRPTVHFVSFGVKSPPLFPPSYILKVPSADAVFDFWALLHREIVIKSVTLDQPQINIISDPDGPWNFENPASPNSKNLFPFGIIDKVTISRGQLIASNLLPSDAQGPSFSKPTTFPANSIASTSPPSSIPPLSPSMVSEHGKPPAYASPPSKRPMSTQNSDWSRVKSFSPISKPTSAPEKPPAIFPSAWPRAPRPSKPTHTQKGSTSRDSSPTFTTCEDCSPELSTVTSSLPAPSNTPTGRSPTCTVPATSS